MMGMMGKRGRRGTANPLTYTGREYESSTGLYYYRARYYNPGVGRFISVDPLIRQFARSYAESSTLSGGSGGCGSCGGLGRGSVPEVSSVPSVSIKWRHPYVYVRNNPVNYVDPEGLNTYEGEWERIIQKYETLVLQKISEGWWCGFKTGSGLCADWQSAVFNMLRNLAPPLKCWRYARYGCPSLFGISHHAVIVWKKYEIRDKEGKVLDPWYTCRWGILGLPLRYYYPAANIIPVSWWRFVMCTGNPVVE